MASSTYFGDASYTGLAVYWIVAKSDTLDFWSTNQKFFMRSVTSSALDKTIQD